MEIYRTKIKIALRAVTRTSWVARFHDEIRNLNPEFDYLISITELKNKRSLAQNKAQWPILQAFERQVKWPVNGEMVFISSEEWKDILTAGWKNETPRVAMGWDGKGMVMLGLRTKKIPKPDFNDWLEFLNAAAAMKGVKIPVRKSDLDLWSNN